MASIYQTVQGDTWDAISYKVYESELLFHLLLQANPEHVNTVIFGGGITLTIPEQPPEVFDGLPPWKSGEID